MNVTLLPPSLRLRVSGLLHRPPFEYTDDAPTPALQDPDAVERGHWTDWRVTI